MLHTQDYHDQLVADLGANPRRKVRGLRAWRLRACWDECPLVHPGSIALLRPNLLVPCTRLRLRTKSPSADQTANGPRHAFLQGWNPLREAFSCYTARDYAPLFDQGASKLRARHPDAQGMPPTFAPLKRASAGDGAHNPSANPSAPDGGMMIKAGRGAPLGDGMRNPSGRAAEGSGGDGDDEREGRAGGTGRASGLQDASALAAAL